MSKCHIIVISTFFLSSWVQKDKVVHDNFGRLSGIASSIVPLSCLESSLDKEFFALCQVLSQDVGTIAVRCTFVIL